MIKDAQLYVGQKAFIEKDGKILVLKDIWGLDYPGGKIQEGELKHGDVESLKDSLKREIREEVGIEVEVGDPFFAWYHAFPKNHKYYGTGVYAIVFKARYLSGEIRLSDEHLGMQWVDKDTYKSVDDGSDYVGALKKYFS